MGDNSPSEIGYATQYMQQLAQTRQTTWPQDAVAGRKKIDENTLALDDFGKLDAFKSFGQVYMAARTVYLETLDGVRQDLEAAATGIVTSARQMNDRDDQAGAAFLTLQQRWENGLANEQSQTSASQSQQVQQAAQTQEAAAEQVPETNQGQPQGTPAGGPAAPPSGPDNTPTTSTPATVVSPSSTPTGGLSTPSIK